jgi:hypothetical protein
MATEMTAGNTALDYKGNFDRNKELNTRILRNS